MNMITENKNDQSDIVVIDSAACTAVDSVVLDENNQNAEESTELNNDVTCSIEHPTLEPESNPGINEINIELRSEKLSTPPAVQEQAEAAENRLVITTPPPPPTPENGKLINLRFIFVFFSLLRFRVWFLYFLSNMTSGQSS